MDKLNIADLLKDCPRGMELDCTMYEDVYFDHVDELQIIHCYIERKLCKTSITFNQYGTPNSDIKSKCVIFPKGKTTWDDFHRPFKDGDIIYNPNIKAVGIFNKQTDDKTISHCFLNIYNQLRICHYHSKFLDDWRFATEEEKLRLFFVIKENGYKWNPETKTLEKLIEPKFKVGDDVQWCLYAYMPIRTIKSIENDRYKLDDDTYIKFGDEYAYRLIKFDVSTLKPFDKVLVRCNTLETWHISFFEKYNRELTKYPFVCINGNKYAQCVPYKDNEYLLDTADNCDDFYKTW